MADTHFPDEWLAHSLGDVLPPDRLLELRGKAAPGATLWECVVAEKLATDEQILTALSTRSSRDRKSTRLNSSHGYISYAVFCLKKKKKQLDVRQSERADCS